MGVATEMASGILRVRPGTARMDRDDAEAHAGHMSDYGNATGETTSAPPPPTPPRLTRSTDDKVVAGLCGGLGRHFGVDPVIFRIGFVVMALAGGSGVLLYLVGWLLVPEDGSDASVVDRARQGHGSQVVGAILLAMGAIVLLGAFGIFADDG